MPETIEIASSRGLLRLRPEREDDLAFRLRLFGDSRPDLALLPLDPAAREQLMMLQFRNVGIGSAIMRALMQEAGRTQTPLRLHVASSNDAAMRLYVRLGFVPVETSAAHTELEWRAPAPATESGLC